MRCGGNVFFGSLASSFETPRNSAAPQDEVLDPHGEERGNAARLEPRGQGIRAHDQPERNALYELFTNLAKASAQSACQRDSAGRFSTMSPAAQSIRRSSRH